MPESSAYVIKAFLISIAVVNIKPCRAALDTRNEVVEVPIKPQIVKYEVSDQPGVVKLKCNILKNSIKKNRITGVNELRWETKKCGYGLHLTNCADFQSMPWTPVMCKNGSKFCDGYILKLDNPTPRDSGYYRCLYKNYMSKQFRVYKMFHLDVYDPEERIEILEEPAHYDNQTVHENDTVIFRCRAQSLSPLHMLWAKLAEPEHRGSRPIQYGSHAYELLSSGGAYNVGNDLYISKLTIPNCQVVDNGRYYCIIISVNNAHLLKNKSMSLTVMPKLLNYGQNLQPYLTVKFLLIWIIVFN